jgi:hypothetical protein
MIASRHTAPRAGRIRVLIHREADARRETPGFWWLEANTLRREETERTLGGKVMCGNSILIDERHEVGFALIYRNVSVPDPTVQNVKAQLGSKIFPGCGPSPRLGESNRNLTLYSPVLLQMPAIRTILLPSRGLPGTRKPGVER